MMLESGLSLPLYGVDFRRGEHAMGPGRWGRMFLLDSQRIRPGKGRDLPPVDGLEGLIGMVPFSKLPFVFQIPAFHIRSSHGFTHSARVPSPVLVPLRRRPKRFSVLEPPFLAADCSIEGPPGWHWLWQSLFWEDCRPGIHRSLHFRRGCAGHAPRPRALRLCCPGVGHPNPTAGQPARQSGRRPHAERACATLALLPRQVVVSAKFGIGQSKRVGHGLE